MKKKNYLLCFFIGLVSLSLIFPLSVNAEGQTNGGSVQTGGDIGFYYEKTEPSASSEEVKTSGGTLPDTKPSGLFPSTGELITASLSISGVVLLMFALLFFYLKKKKEKEQEEI